MDLLQKTFGSRSDGGQIQLILGPMFSGKSTELMRRIKRYQIAARRCLTIKYANDNRYSDSDMSAHDGQTIAAVQANSLLNLLDKADDFDVIGLDEGQFFPDVVEFAEELANRGKTVVIAALDGTYQRKKFNRILELVPLAEYVVKLSAVCMICAGDAAFTKRIKTTDDRLELIGGTDFYMATCRECFYKKEKQTESLKRYPLNENSANIESANIANIESTKENIPV